MIELPFTRTIFESQEKIKNQILFIFFSKNCEQLFYKVATHNFHKKPCLDTYQTFHINSTTPKLRPNALHKGPLI